MNIPIAVQACSHHMLEKLWSLQIVPEPFETGAAFFIGRAGPLSVDGYADQHDTILGNACCALVPASKAGGRMNKRILLYHVVSVPKLTHGATEHAAPPSHIALSGQVSPISWVCFLMSGSSEMHIKCQRGYRVEDGRVLIHSDLNGT